MTGIPTGWTKARPEIDQDIARKLFLAKRPGFGQDFFPAAERAMRLLIAETPNGGKLRESSQLRVFLQNVRRVFGRDKEEIEGQHRLRRRGNEASQVSRQVEGAVRPMEEESPSGRTHYPGNGHARAENVQARDALAILHRIDLAAAVKLRASFSQSVEERHPLVEADCAVLDSEAEPRNYPSPLSLHGKNQWVGQKPDLQLSPGDGLRSGLRSGESAGFCRRLRPISFKQIGSWLDGLGGSILGDRKNADAKRKRTDDSEVKFHALASDKERPANLLRQCGRRDLFGPLCEESTAAEGPEESQCVAT